MQELELPAAVPIVGARRERQRTLVIVAGSGRSGTSLLSGILQRLGFHVPQPEVPADTTNPRGFAEPQWVVDFHSRLLRTASVHASDGRPAAWAETARLGLDPAVQRELSGWLRRQFRESDQLLVKDPRLSWFLPLWRRCTEEAGGSPRFVTILRHPGSVVDSKQRSYGVRQGEVARAAGWVHQALFTERATRDNVRAFVLYEELLDDWTRTIVRLGQTLDLEPIRDAPATSMREVHEFVDRALNRSRADWGDAQIPDGLRSLADEVWQLMSKLADADALQEAAIGSRLDELREAYVRLYSESEGIAYSSIAAAARGLQPRRASAAPLGVRLVRKLPRGVRRAVPLELRIRIARVLRGRGRGGG